MPTSELDNLFFNVDKYNYNLIQPTTGLRIHTSIK
jgi:hypothetical protein